MPLEDLDEVPAVRDEVAAEAMAVERTLSSQEATVAHQVVTLCQCVINDIHKPSEENLKANQTSRLECEALQAKVDKIAKNIACFLGYIPYWRVHAEVNRQYPIFISVRMIRLYARRRRNAWERCPPAQWRCK